MPAIGASLLRAALPEDVSEGPSDTHSLEPRTRPGYGFTRAEADEHFRISVPQARLLRAHKALSPSAVMIGWDEPRGWHDSGKSCFSLTVGIQMYLHHATYPRSLI